jgi:hypothetical protein
MSEEILDHAADEFEGMTINQLRSAAKLYNVAVARDMNSDDIRGAIRRKVSKHKMVTKADTSTGPAPGKYRIILHKTTDMGAKVGGRPATVMVNGYRCTIPRNIPVDVPEKVVRVLENSVHYVTVEQEDRTSAHEPVLSYPFQVLAHTPGKDPSPGYEKGKERWYRVREQFWKKFGFWPKNQAMLREAIKDGHIKDPFGLVKLAEVTNKNDATVLE